MPTAMIPLTLRPHQSRAALDNRLSLVSVPVKPQPTRIEGDGPDRLLWFPKNLRNREGGVSCVSALSNMHLFAPFAPGDVLYGREEYWLFNHGNTYRGLGIEYKAGGYKFLRKKPRGCGKLCCWRPARTMPPWAARIFLEVVSVKVGRLHDIADHRGCLAHGWPGATQLLDPSDTTSHFSGATKGDWIEAIGDGDDGCIEWFADEWNAAHKSTPWEANPFVWTAKVRRVSKV